MLNLPEHLSFNPRLRTGGDLSWRTVLTLDAVSIHASAREATGVAGGPLEKHKGFNPRLRTGGD